jgi:hypothetical protein
MTPEQRLSAFSPADSPVWPIGTRYRPARPSVGPGSSIRNGWRHATPQMLTGARPPFSGNRPHDDGGGRRPGL